MASTTISSQSPDPDGMSLGGNDGSLSLPVIPEGQPYRKNRRMARRRATVLILVQLAIIAHVVMWVLSREYGWFGGKTITPIEPSESMEFSKYGVINAGLIFFLLALFSTMILGRWFCGWGCHVVMLQDFCLWLMGRFKIRPKPFRSRLLLWAPLILAIYMFIWPLFYRFVIAPFTRPELEWPGISVHLTTTDFWATFPGVTVAIIFLGICGFATVYMLGAKGFCTYGCPYGGFFAPLDKIAPLRIRLTGDCDDCGRCTASCTSNVRVHEEVRSWGMVTDPGCMKTMDCVANCPTDAIKMGFGPPAVSRAKHQRETPKPVKWDLSLTEEIVLALTCLLLFWAWRGLYASIPMLMAIGIATVLTFMFWKGWRLIRDPNLNLHRWRLKFHGRVQLPGFCYALIVLILIVASVQAIVIRIAIFNGDRLRERVDMPVAIAINPDRPVLTQAGLEDVEGALASYRFASRMSDGGIGFADDPNVRLAMSRLYLIKGEGGKSLELLREVDQQVGPDESVDRVMLLVMGAVEPESVDAHIDQRLKDHPDWIEFRIMAVDRALAAAEMTRAERLLAEGMESSPEALPLIQRQAVVYVQAGRLGEGTSLMRRYLELAPRDALAWTTLAQTLAMMDLRTEAEEAITQALKWGGDNPAVLVDAIGYYRMTGRSGLARELEARLARLNPRR